MQSTVVIPAQPVLADAAAAPQGNQGVTLDGVVIAASAPVDAILGAFTIAAFDDCGSVPDRPDRRRCGWQRWRPP